VTWQLLESDAQTLVLSLPGTRLDPSAPTRLQPDAGGPVTRVTAFDRADIDTPEVRVVIARAAGAVPEVSQRGAILALDFAREAAQQQGVPFQFVNAELADVVKAVSELTGERFLMDDVRGRVTISIADRVTPAEAMEVLNAALWVRGLGAVPTPGRVWRIVPIAGLASTAPVDKSRPGPDSEAPVTTLVHLETADAAELASQLAPWTGTRTTVIPYPPTNGLILAGNEDRLHGLLGMVGALDEAEEEQVLVRQLRHADAATLADQLEEIYEPDLRVMVDERRNALVLRLPAARVEEVREHIALLDQPVHGGGSVQVIPIRYTDPSKLADLIQQLAAGTADTSEAKAAGLEGRSVSVAVDPSTRSLVVIADSDTQALVRDLVGQLDRVPPRVEVEAVVLEIITDESLEIGFDAFLRLTRPNSADDLRASVLSNPSGGGLIQPGQEGSPAGALRYTRSPLIIPVVDAMGMPQTLQLPRDSFAITAEGREVESHVLMRPYLLVANGEEQQIFSGDNLPIAVSNTENTNALQTRQNIQRQDVGVTLRVEPSIGEAGGVWLKTLIEASSLAASAAGNVEQVGPTLRSRRVETRVYLRDGEWAVIGAGKQPELRRVEVGTPWLKDIPVLGHLVKQTTTRRLEAHLVVAIQARIQRSRDEQIANTIRRRLGMERLLARTGPVLEKDEGPLALLVTTQSTESQAQALADTLGGGSQPVRVAPWEFRGAPRFDVYLTGFRSLSDASAAAMPLLDEGWVPQVVVVGTPRAP
jgi:general secretion pathway protein D